jgi:TolA-binding protein
MKPPADGWDRDEQEALAPFEDQLAAMRAKHASELSEHDKARILKRIYSQVQHREARPEAAREPIFWTRPWLLAAASIVAIAGATWIFSGQIWRTATPAPLPELEGTADRPPPAPVFYLSLNKPDVRVGPAALTYRSAAGESSFLADLKPAFDAFRAGDYAAADREFSTLAARYPKAVEVLFYQGISRLYLNELPTAIASLTAAEKSADSAFAWDAAWYLAVAEERAGNLAAARTRLANLCRQADIRAPTACEALKKLPEK